MAEINYTSYEDADLTKEVLLEDPDFLTDAETFLAERENLTFETDEEIYDSYMEHFRFQNANEVTAVLDLSYAQDADDEGRLRLGRLMETFNRMPSDIGWEAAGDYGEAILKAPSTYAAFLTGGAGKVAGVGAGLAARTGIRGLLSAAGRKITGGTLTTNVGKEVAKGAVRGGTVDALAGGATDAFQQQTEQQVGTSVDAQGNIIPLRDDVDYGRMALRTGMSAVPGTALGGLSRGIASKQAGAAANLLKIDAKATAARIANGDKEVAKVAGKKLDAKVKELVKTHEKLNPLDPTKVKEGGELMEGVSKAGDPDLRTGLDLGVIKRVAAAAMEVEKKLKIKGPNRITENIADALAEGKIKPEDITSLYARFGISAEDFSKIYMHEVSQAGKTLQAQSMLKKLLLAGDELEEAGLTSVSRQQIDLLVNSSKAIGTFVKNLDKARLGMMTSQMATAMRNTSNGVMRIGVDAVERMFYNAINLRNPFGKDTFALVGAMANQKHSSAIVEFMTRRAPDKMARVFRAMADVESYTQSAATNSIMVKAARKLNFMNTMSDNMFKRSVITASIKRQMGDRGQDLNKILRDGEFDTIPPSVLEQAMEDALKFTYQYTPKGKNTFSAIAKGAIRVHQDIPFVLSSVIPFPRFIANSIQFIYEHTPVLPLLNLERITVGMAKKPAVLAKSNWSKESLSKQLTGAAMLTGAFLYRMEANKDGLKWYEFHDPNGGIIDGRAMLGPFAPFFLAADIIARFTEEGKGEKGEFSSQADARIYTRDVLQSFAGSTFRVGTGLYLVDELFDALGGQDDLAEDKALKIMSRFVGDTMNTFMIPLNQVQDVMSQFNPEMRVLKETRDINWFTYLRNRARRSTEFGLDTLPVKESGIKEANIRRKNPLIKQFSGLTYREDKTALEQEFDRLQIEQREYLPYSGDAEFDRLAAKYMGPLAEKIANKVLNDPEYTNIKGTKVGGKTPFASIKDADNKKAIMLIEALRFAAKEAKKAAEAEIEKTGGARVTYKRLDRRVRGSVNAHFRKQYGMSVSEAAAQDPDKWAEAVDVSKSLK